MDDLQQLLGLTNQSPEQQQALKELARRANDRLRVQNLLDEDYFVAWDMYGSGGRFLIPARTKDIGFGAGQAVHPRYIAFKFFKEVSNIILSNEVNAAIDAENMRRKDMGRDEMDKTEAGGKEGELHFVMSHGLRTNNQDRLIELLPKVILGVEQEWGMDALPYQKSEDRIKWDNVMAMVNRPVQKVDSAPIEPVDMPPTNTTPEQEVRTEDALADVE